MTNLEFSEEKEIAKVTRLRKWGDVNVLANYKAISSLPVFSEGFEKKILHSRLTSLLDKHNVFSESHFGFRNKLPTEIAPLKQKELIINAFQNKPLAVGVFTDLTKALPH